MDIFSEAQCGFGVEYIRRVARPQRESWGLQVFAIHTVIFIHIIEDYRYLGAAARF